MKNIALGTSKINYIDPRITIAFIKKHNIPLEKLFSKALMEKVAIAASRNSTHTTVCLTRYGNVMASRGSVIPLFLNQIKKSWLKSNASLNSPFLNKPF